MTKSDGQHSIHYVLNTIHKNLMCSRFQHMIKDAYYYIEWTRNENLNNISL